MVHQLSRADARRIAVRAQGLTRQRPTDLMSAVRTVSALQLDPTKAIAVNAELVLWSRLGSSFDTRDLWDAVDELALIEHRGMLRPAEEIALFRAAMEAWPGSDAPGWKLANAEWVQANNVCRLDILDLLRTDGPLPQKDLPDTCVVPWKSSGWNNNKNLTMLLGLLVERGEVAPAGRRGRDRLWDLAGRIYPDEDYPPLEEAGRLRNERRLKALGIARPKAPASPGEPTDVGAAGEPAVVEGVKGEWRVDPAQLGQPFEGRAALLSPLDQLLHDRKRMNDVFGFEYYLEMYKPAEQRRWGYFALPILYDDRLVGKLDAAADRKEGVLRVAAVHEDVAFTEAMSGAVEREIADLALWLGLDLAREA